jgi:hypothetical protein
MSDLDTIRSNLALARDCMDQNDTVTAAVYYETTLSYIHG